MESTLSDLDSRLTNVEKEVTPEAQADIKNQIFATLPRKSASNEPDAMSVEDIANEINEDRSRVSSILLKLETETSMVDQTMMGDKHKSYWYREG